MATLTLDLIRKKAEHHTDLLSSLQELSLHQLDLATLTPLLASCCPNLRILYLHNNLLSSPSVFRHITRLHSLSYLNLTLNNVTAIPPLTSHLSALTKLDLTLNHIPLSALTTSIASLAVGNDRLRELYFTGNPCTTWRYYRLYVVGMLKQLERLDGVEVRRGERIEAQHRMSDMETDLDAELLKEQQQQQQQQQYEHKEHADAGEEKEQSATKFTPELRLRMYHEQQAAEAARAAASAAATPQPPPNLYTAAMSSLSALLDPSQYTSTLPSQRNTGRYEWTLSSPESSPHLLVLSLSLPRHLDSSWIKVDVHPLWLQVAVKNKLLVLHCLDEVEPGSATTQRVMSDGRLLVKMRKLRYTQTAADDNADGKVAEVISKQHRQRQQQRTAAAEHDGETARKDTGGIKEVSARRSVTLEAKLLAERQQQRAAVIADEHDEVPPLI